MGNRFFSALGVKGFQRPITSGGEASRHRPCLDQLAVDECKPSLLKAAPLEQLVDGFYCDLCGVGFVTSEIYKVSTDNRPRDDDRGCLVETVTALLMAYFRDCGCVVVCRTDGGYAGMKMARREQESMAAVAVIAEGAIALLVLGTCIFLDNQPKVLRLAFN